VSKTHIVIHHSASADTSSVNAQDIRRWHKERRWRDIGYHLVIERVGTQYEAIIGRPFTEAGAHCANGGMNHRGVGVCFVGDFDKDRPDPEMLRFGARHLRAICEMLAIPIERSAIVGHKEVPGASTACPGRHFPMDTLVALVRAA
jgi:N-acetylmuramoyl-L-alanine amidase